MHVIIIFRNTNSLSVQAFSFSAPTLAVGCPKRLFFKAGSANWKLRKLVIFFRKWTFNPKLPLALPQNKKNISSQLLCLLPLAQWFPFFLILNDLLHLFPICSNLLLYIKIYISIYQNREIFPHKALFSDGREELASWPIVYLMFHWWGEVQVAWMHGEYCSVLLLAGCCPSWEVWHHLK